MICSISTSRRCLTVLMSIAILADLGLTLFPLFILFTRPVSLNFNRRRLIVSIRGSFPPRKTIANCRCVWVIKLRFHDLHSLLHSILLSICWGKNSLLRCKYFCKWKRNFCYFGNCKNSKSGNTLLADPVFYIFL